VRTMSKKKPKKTKKSARAKKTMTSSNPVVRFATRLGVARRGLEEAYRFVDPKSVLPNDPHVRQQFKEVADIIEKALRDSA
jgi:hypothetical protein